MRSSLPLDKGLEYEKGLFEACLYGPQSKAMIHVFFAEREVSKIPGAVGDVVLPPVGKAAVLGAGTMGRGIAMCFANAGIPVVLSDQTSEALSVALASIRETYETGVKKGKLSPAEMGKRLELIRPGVALEGFDEADIVRLEDDHGR